MDFFVVYSVNLYRRIAQTFPIQSLRFKQSKLTAWTLKKGPVRCTETSVRIATLHCEKSQNNADLKDKATNIAKQFNLKYLYLLLKQWRSVVKIRFIVKFVTYTENKVVFVTLIKFDVWLTVHRSSLRNKKPTRCHLVLYLFLLYKLINMFRATLCTSSGADDLVVFFSRVV